MNNRFLKRIAAFVSFLTVSLILWNTYTFFNKFKQEERLKMEILATAQKEVATNTDLTDDLNLPLKVIESNKNIPMILVNSNDEIINTQNIDFIKPLNPNQVKELLEKMKSENEPIEFKITDTEKQYIYYSNSNLLNKLSYYPLALILILVLFITLIYMFYNSYKIAETNKLWTGMAKETAHQIGTPLSSLLGWIAILKAENINNKYIEEIENDVNRLNVIANRFSKIGSRPELKNENIVKVSKQVFDYLRLISSKKISFLFTANSEEIYIKINAELFGWVIENLIKNSIDAMPDTGSLHLDIIDSPSKITISVKDTGKGIVKKLIKQIFKPGFTTKKRGWGLGLSLSKRIIEDYHKGKISVQKSDFRRGTTFNITFYK